MNKQVVTETRRNYTEHESLEFSLISENQGDALTNHENN